MLGLAHAYKHLSRKGFWQGWAVWNKGRGRGHSQCKRWEDLKGEQEVPQLTWTNLPTSLSEHIGTSGVCTRCRPPEDSLQLSSQLSDLQWERCSCSQGHIFHLWRASWLCSVSQPGKPLTVWLWTQRIISARVHTKLGQNHQHHWKKKSTPTYNS